MKNIDHLPAEEKQHFILCDCGHYVDMRDLSQVFSHLHAAMPQPQWSHSVKVGEAKAYTKTGRQLGLN
jgi:hypothetical protein